MTPRIPAIVVLSAMSLAPLPACKPKELALDDRPPPANAPTLQELLATHNQRVERLYTTYSEGVIEIRWRDDRGKHFEQGDLEFWQTTDDRTALRVGKLGEPLLWLGSNKDEYWLFDMLSKDDRVLYQGRHDEALELEGLGAMGLRPLALLDLLALTPIDPQTADKSSPQFDRSLGAWMVQARGRGGAMRVYFDQATLLPKRVQSLNGDGAMAAESDLSRYETVQIPGLAVMAQPKMAEIVDIRRSHPGVKSRGEDNVSGEVKIAINETVGHVEGKVLERIFDLPRLMTQMRPHRVENMAVAPQASAATP